MQQIDKWITFTAGNVLSVMNDDKTQTRRVIRPQPEIYHTTTSKIQWMRWKKGNRSIDARMPWALDFLKKHSRYKVGDILGVKEGYRINGHAFGRSVEGVYLADNAYFEIDLTFEEHGKWNCRKFPYRNTPGRFMYRSLARTFIRVLSVKVERVQDITPAAAIAEGTLGWWKSVNNGVFAPIDDGIRPYKYDRAALVQKFGSLWDSINKKRGFGWDANPWVWCVQFGRTAYEHGQ